MPEPGILEAALRQSRYWWNKLMRGALDRPKHRFALLHVPRCAGTSLAQALSEHFPPHRVARLQTSATAHVAQGSGRHLEPFRRELLWYLARSKDYELITGHAGFSQQLFADLRPRWSFITLLRDPEDRFLSSYFYRCHKSSPHATLDLDLAQYLDTRQARQSGAIYVRYFAGDDAREPTPERIDRAVSNLKRLQLVGITERLGDFTAAFRRQFGLALRLPQRNNSPAPPAAVARQVTPTLRARVAALCAPDREVYDQICNLIT